MPFIGDIHHSSYLSGSNQQPLSAERRRPGLSSAMSSGVPGRHFQWNLNGFQIFNRSKSLLPQEAWRMGIMGTGSLTDNNIHGISQVPSSLYNVYNVPFQLCMRLSLKMEHSLGLTLRGDLSSMDTSGIGMTIVTMTHAPRHPTWAQLSCKAQALSYDFMAAALSYSRNLRFLMPTYALSSPRIGNVSRALFSTDWPAYGEPTWIHYGTLWPVSFLQQLRQLHLQRNHLSLAAARNSWHLQDKNHLNATPPVVQRALPASGLVFFRWNPFWWEEIEKMSKQQRVGVANVLT